MPFERGPTTPGLGDLLTILLVVSTPRMSWDPPSRRGVTRLWISCRGDRQTTKFWDPIILRLRENMNYWNKNNIYIYICILPFCSYYSSKFPRTPPSPFILGEKKHTKTWTTRGEEGPKIGLFLPKSHDVFEAAGCPAHHPAINQALEADLNKHIPNGKRQFIATSAEVTQKTAV